MRECYRNATSLQFLAVFGPAWVQIAVICRSACLWRACSWKERSLDVGGTLVEAAGVPVPGTEIPSVDWWLTSHCNLACDFCYGPVPGKDPVDRREAILGALAASSARVVTFCGGEPLLVRRIDQYADTLAQRGKATVLNTNGQLLRRRMDQGFRLGAFSMAGLSIEGSTPEVHRAMRGAKADLDEVIAVAQIVASESGVGLKLATVVSGVNREDLPYLAKSVRNLRPQVWRLYEYSSRGDQNVGQERHRLPAGQFALLVEEAAERAAPVPTAPSTEAETEGCLIVDPAGNVLQPVGSNYVRRGNCLEQSLDDIWANIPKRSSIVSNKKWLSVLA